MKRHGIKSGFLLLTILYGFVFSSVLAISEDSGYEVYKEMVDVYSRVDTYSDKGVIKTQKPGSRYIEVMTFATNYDSFGTFSFEWRKIGGAFDKKLNYIKKDENKIEIEMHGKKFNKNGLTSALQSLAGVTKSASYFVTRYFLPEVQIINLAGVHEISLDKIFKNHDKYKYLLTIEYTYGGVEKIWLNSDYLIVKMQTSIKRLDGVVIRREITIKPKIRNRCQRAIVSNIG